MISWFNTLGSSLINGLIIGMLFGFLLQKGGVGRYATIIKQFLLQDMTVLKIMLSAIISGGIVLYGSWMFGFIETLPLKSSTYAHALIGGLLFGIGMSLVGYCPGTALAALGEGALDALGALGGMFIGGILFTMTFPLITPYLARFTATQETLPSLLHVHALFFFGTFIAILFFIEKWYPYKKQ